MMSRNAGHDRSRQVWTSFGIGINFLPYLNDYEQIRLHDLNTFWYNSAVGRVQIKVIRRQTVMVIGKIGSGKSFFLNKLSGHDTDEPFESEMCTKDPKQISFEHYNLLDTPGLYNPLRLTSNWAQKLNDWSERQNAN